MVLRLLGVVTVQRVCSAACKPLAPRPYVHRHIRSLPARTDDDSARFRVRFHVFLPGISTGGTTTVGPTPVPSCAKATVITALKDRLLGMDRTTGRSWWQYGAGQETADEHTRKHMSAERFSKLRDSLRDWGAC